MSEYTLTLTQQEVGLLGNVLGQLPYAQSAGLIAKIREQVQAQDAARAVDVDWGAKWQHAARNLLRPEDYERLAAAVNCDAATPSGSR